MPEPRKAVAKYIESVHERIEKDIEQLLGNSFEEWKVLVVDTDVTLIVEKIANKVRCSSRHYRNCGMDRTGRFSGGEDLGELSANVWTIKPDGWKLWSLLLPYLSFTSSSFPMSSAQR